MTSEDQTTISILGPGALGGALIDLLHYHTQSFFLHSVWGRKQTDNYLLQNGNRIRPDLNFPETASDLGDILFLTTPDDRIEELTKQFAALNIDWSNKSVVHFSGSHSSNLLTLLSAEGASVASLHPLQTFTKGDKAERFKDIWFTMEGDDELFPLLEKFIKQAGANITRLNKEQKKAMHLAAVFASNYLVSLMNAAEHVAEYHKIDRAVLMLEPLIRQTLENVLQKGTKQSLTGPIARGDLSTLKNHLDLMEEQPGIKELYKQLGNQALTIAKSSGNISGDSVKKIQKILSTEEE